jgi:hypothetical protein
MRKKQSQKNGVATLNLAVKFRLLLVPPPIFLFLYFRLKIGHPVWKISSIVSDCGMIKGNFVKMDRQLRTSCDAIVIFEENFF